VGGLFESEAGADVVDRQRQVPAVELAQQLPARVDQRATQASLHLNHALAHNQPISVQSINAIT